MSDGKHQARESDRPRLRHEFVGMMFALAIGEVGLQAASLVYAGFSYRSLPAYTHLILATTVIATSWVGWSLSTAPGGREDVRGVFQWEFVVLLVDVALVVAYFILVRTIDFTKGEHRVEPASTQAGILFAIFALYLVWDIISKFAISKANKDEAWLRKFGPRMIPTVICLAVSGVIWISVQKADNVHRLTFDFAFICLVLLFRSLKDVVSAIFPREGDLNNRSLLKAAVWSIALTCGVVFGTLASDRSWPLPLPSHIAGKINAHS